MFLFTHCSWLFDHHAFARLQTSIRGIWNARYELKAGSAQKREIKEQLRVFCPFWGYGSLCVFYEPPATFLKEEVKELMLSLCKTY